MKQNDWIVANINNPEFTVEDFRDIGMDLDNTQILPMENYLDSKFITSNPAFQNDSGEFQKDKFEDFYRNKVASFGSFQSTDDRGGFEYDMFDTDANTDSRIKDPHFRIDFVSNPDRVTTGISARNKMGEKKLTPSEIAQTQKIYDPETDSFLDETPNDSALVKSPIKYIKSLFDDPLVLATWEEDGEHIDPITKRTVKHQKGDYKVNEEGTYYTEKLNGRSLIGKKVITAFDTLTIDGEGINKYDFFDSDSLDKSVTGTIAKAAASVAPLFLGGPVATVYAAALVGREMAKSLPMLYGMVGSIFGNVEDSTVLNSIAAVGEKFTGGVSEYSQKNTFTFENVANLMADVATQWGQQKLIAKSIQSLRGGNKALQSAYGKAQLDYAMKAADIQAKVKTGQLPSSALSYLGDAADWQNSPLGKAALQRFVPAAEALAKKQARLGADASLAYMAIISNTDVYESMLEHGASKREAAAVALGSTMGMFTVDKYLGLGELFFDDLTADSQRAIRNAFKKEAEGWKNSITEIIKNPETTYKNKITSLLKTGIGLGKNAAKGFAEDLKYHSTGFVGKAIGEGLEETSEELVADLSKQLYELAGDMGFDTSTKDVGAWENALPRYGMSFFGGMLGGGLFYGVDVVQNGRFKRDTSQDELIYLVRNKKTKDLLQELKQWKDKGKLGSKNLSATKYELDDKGNRIYLTADSESDSQNEFIYNRMRESILQLDNIINENNVGLGEDELFRQMVLSEARFLQLKDVLQDQSYTTGYQELFQNTVRDLIKAEDDLNAASKTIDGLLPKYDADGNMINGMTDEQKRGLNQDEINRREKNLDVLRQKRDNLLLERDSFLNGEKSFPYTRKMLFAMDSGLNEEFISMTYPQWLKANKDGKSPEDLSLEEAKSFKEEYLQYKKGEQKRNLTTQFQTFLNIEKQITPHLLEIQENQQNFKKFNDSINRLFQENSPFNVQYLTYDSKLEGESDDIYNIRNTRLENETPQDFMNRQAERRSRIEAANDELTNQMAQQVMQIIQESGGFVDPITQRAVHRSLSTRKQDLANSIISNSIASFSPILEVEGIRDIDSIDQAVINEIKKLNPDLSNLDEIRKTIQDLVYKPVRDDLSKANALISNFRQGLVNLFDKYGFTYDPSNITGKTLEDYIAFRNQELQLDEDSLFEYYGEEDEDDSPIFEYEQFEEATNITQPEVVSMINQFRNASDREAISYNLLYSDEQAREAKVQERGAQLLEEYNRLLSSTADSLKNNGALQMLVTVDQNVQDVNPVTQLVKKIALSLNKDSKNIENVLQTVSEIYEQSNNAADFQLTDEQIQDFIEASHLLRMTKAYLYAASTQSSYTNPIGHNITINEFAENHKDIVKDFQPLATIDADVANTYIMEIDKYLEEIGIGDEDAEKGYWRRLSDTNAINKKQKFIRAETSFNKSRYDFFQINRDAFTFDLDGTTVDLLEGFEKIPAAGIEDDNNLIIINQVENLLYDNIQAVMSKGYSLEEILEKSQILQNITNVDKIDIQSTSSLDDSIAYSKWTDYDKAVYLLTAASLRANDFNMFLRQRVQEEPDIVPLTIQEYISRVAISALAGKNIMKSGLNYLRKISKHQLPLLNNIVFVDGVAGAGKTQVIARNVSKYINSDNIWLSTPKESQLDTLSKVIGRGKAKIRKDLMEEILDPAVYSSIMSAVEGNKDSEYFSKSKGVDNSSIVILNKDKIEFKKGDAPDLIIIDEITHFSNIELQILNAYAEQNGVSILGLGDSNQNGFSKLGSNIDREVCLTVRAPKLSISLRDVNLQKQSNLNSTITALDELQHIEGDSKNPAAIQKLNSIKTSIKGLHFKVYNQDTIHGDLITPVLTADDAKKLFGTVGYVGSTNSNAYKVLKEAGIEPVVMTTEEVQGQEFDYIVVDKPWQINLQQANPYQTLLFMQDLYTMMSRGRSGSILIDNGLSNIIGNNKIELTTATAPNMRDAAEEFRAKKLEVLDQIEATDSKQEQETPQQEEPPGEQPPKQEPKPEDVELKDRDQEPTEQEVQELVRQQLQKTQLGDDSEEQNSLEQYELLQSDLPIRVYGSAHVSGFRVESEEGKNVWYTDGNTTRDLGIFTKQDKIESGAEKDQLVRNLLALKSVILYAKDWSSLPAQVSEIIPEKNYKEMKFKIEVRPKQASDNFVGYSGLDNSKIEINGLVYSVVASFKNKNGEDCTVTLGLLARPDTWKRSLPILQSKIDQVIEQTTDLQQKQALQDYKTKTLPTKIETYNSIIQTMANKYNNQKVKENLYFDITPNFSGLTYLRKTTSGGNQVKVLPLASDSDIEGYDRQEDRMDSFINANPYLVTSDVYIYTGGIPGVKDDAMRGKAVVFVSGDTTLSPEELPALYQIQKEQTAKAQDKNPFNLDYKPSVRMVALNNRGVSFQSLCNPRLKDLYATKGTNSKVNENGEEEVHMNVFPFEVDYMGQRMYVSMWNFRASLTRFLSEYNTFKEQVGLTDDQILNIARANDAIYRTSVRGIVELSQEEIQPILDTYNVSIDQIKLVSNFNDSLANKVREFRLGDSRNSKMLRNLTNIKSDNIYYKGIDNPVGIYLTPQLAQDYLKLLDATFEAVLDPIIKLRDAETGEAWPTDRLISPNSNRKNSLSGLISATEASGNILEIEMEETGQQYNLQFPDLHTTRQVPVLLTRLFKIAKRYGTVEGFDSSRNKINYNKDGQKYPVNYNKLLDILHPGIDGNMIDTRYSNMFSFIFHGTTNPNLESETYKATDAYFKEGFFVDPMFSSEKIEKQGVMLFRGCATDKRLFKVDVAVDMPVFDVTLSNLQSAVNIRQSSTARPTPAKKAIMDDQQKQGLETMLDNISLDSSIVDEYLQNSDSIEQFYDKVVQTVNSELRDITNSAFIQNTANLGLVLDSSVVNGQLVFRTLRDFIQEQTGLSIPENAYVTCDNHELSVDLSDNKVLIVKMNNFNKNLEITQRGVMSEQQIDVIDVVKKSIKDFDSKLDSDVKEELEENSTYVDLIARCDPSEKIDLKFIKQSLKRLSENEDFSDEALDAIDDLITEVSNTETHCNI